MCLLALLETTIVRFGSIVCKKLLLLCRKTTILVFWRPKVVLHRKRSGYDWATARRTKWRLRSAGTSMEQGHLRETIWGAQIPRSGSPPRLIPTPSEPHPSPLQGGRNAGVGPVFVREFNSACAREGLLPPPDGFLSRPASGQFVETQAQRR